MNAFKTGAVIRYSAIIGVFAAVTATWWLYQKTSYEIATSDMSKLNAAKKELAREKERGTKLEKRLKALLDIKKAYSDVIVDGKSVYEVMKGLCGYVEQTTPVKRCRILKVQPDREFINASRVKIAAENYISARMTREMFAFILPKIANVIDIGQVSDRSFTLRVYGMVDRKKLELTKRLYLGERGRK